MLDDTLLNDFIRGFYGYGNYSGAFWFVGMEEGGGGSCDEVSARLTTWATRGRRELEDVAAYHRAFGVHSLFDEHPRIQPTWGKLIRLLLAASGEESIDAQRVREVQRDRLGRLDSHHCLLELLPLPSPSTAHWLYRDCSRLRFLASREEYRAYVAPYRVTHLQQQIERYRPHAVVFYGMGYRWEYWEKIADVRMREYEDAGCIIGRNADTIFVIVKHPAAKGVTSDYFQRVGRLLRPR